MKIHKFLTILFLALVGFAFQVNAKPKKLKVLIVTGQNNHNWKVTSETVKKIYNGSDVFKPTIVISPAKGEDMSGFKPKFKKYDLVCLDYNGNNWPKETQANFVNYVKNGGGVVLFHAADNSFGRWKAYNEIIGVGGWGGRNHNSGPILYWENGKIHKDHSKGRGGSHGKQLSYLVHNRVPNHPILKGLPNEWLHVKDELYHSLRGPAKNVEVLATSEQDVSERGSGRQEPVMLTVRYGKGRVFHTTMGHVGKKSKKAPPLMCTGFVYTFLRASEWVVSGKVTQKINLKLPTKTTTQSVQY